MPIHLPDHLHQLPTVIRNTGIGQNYKFVSVDIVFDLIFTFYTLQTVCKINPYVLRDLSIISGRKVWYNVYGREIVKNLL